MYILRARVIEGSLPMPKSKDKLYAHLTEDNFEIVAPYTKENLQRLFDIGKEAFLRGNLSKMEILAWDGGSADHDGNRLLWMMRPDLCNFERVDPDIMHSFDTAVPVAFSPQERDYYNRFWKPLDFAFSLKAYESMALPRPSLSNRIKQAELRSFDKSSNPIEKASVSLDTDSR